MSTMDCEWILDRLADRVGERLDASSAAMMDAHVAACVECRVALDVARLVARNPVRVPAGLQSRVVRATHAPRATRLPHVRWAMAASIALALLAGGVIWKSRVTPGGVRPPVTAATDEPGGDLLAWPTTDDPLLHGGSSLHELSLDELEILLKELES